MALDLLATVLLIQRSWG